MTCTEYEELVSAFIDGEIDPPVESALFTHLGACVSCRGFLRDAVQLRADLQRQAAVAHPASLDQKVGRSIADRMPSPALESWGAAGAFARRISLRVASVAVAVAAVMGIVLSTLWYRAEGPRETVVFISAVPAVEVRSH